MKRIITSLLIASLVLVAIPAGVCQAEGLGVELNDVAIDREDQGLSVEPNAVAVVGNEDTTDIESACWMADLDDEIYLSEISIPGTHDSGTQYVDLSYVMRCQNTSIAKQLENGYRYIDLRIKLNEEEKDGVVTKRLKIVHNFANCRVSRMPFSEYLYIEDVTEWFYEFLSAYPTETIIANFKIEDSEHSAAEIQQMLFDEINAHREFWYTENEIPQLADVRGKVVLMSRFGDPAGIGESGIHLEWAEQNNNKPVDIPYELYMMESCRLWVQDRYKYSVEDKYEAVIDGLQNCEADENTLFLNFVSTSGLGKVGHPKGYAKQLNKLLLEYDFQSETSYGIIIVDFGSKKLARKIFESNF